MKHLCALSIILTVISSLSANAGLIFEGLPETAVAIQPAASTGLETVYVIRNTDGVKVSYEGVGHAAWSRFGESGAAYAESIGTSGSITLDSSDRGYVVEIGGQSHYFWIVNYENHRFSAISLEPDQESRDCNNAMLKFTGSAKPIRFYSINGRPETLDRDIELSYSTLTFDSEAGLFRMTDENRTFSDLSSVISVPAPLCDTRFMLKGDRFLRAWGAEISIETPTVSAIAVSAETSAEQTERDNDNEQNVSGVSLGGSAPCEITFTASVTDAASFYEWQLSKYPEFDPIDDRYPQTDLTYTFHDQGTTYVRFFAANAEGQCDYYSPTYEVSIGESVLLCPNVFSPQSSPGVNDEWKVSYKSIVSFECHIFNRWGNELHSFTDPSLGWDGKYKGKYVPAGTYYYVIKARGADGRDYKLSGDINIINSKSINSSGSNEN